MITPIRNHENHHSFCFFLLELCKRDLNPQSNRKVLIRAKKFGT